MESKLPDKPLKRPRLRLPFDNRKQDAGEWAYDHRIGLFTTLTIYLLLAIAFVASKITLGGERIEQTLYIDLGTLETLEAERDRLEAELRERQQEEQFDWGQVRNVTSNENVLNEELTTDRGNHAAELNADAAAAAEQMRANREAYERGLADVDAIGRDNGTTAEGESTTREDARVAGYVTVRLDIKNPTRTERHLVKPAFQCEGGGEVVVEVEVRCNGKVSSARVLSGGDDYMREVALRAARSSTVNIDPNAPDRQKGTITYIFIPQ